MDFMKWWDSVNLVLKSRGHEEMRYGEARNFYNTFTEGWEVNRYGVDYSIATVHELQSR